MQRRKVPRSEETSREEEKTNPLTEDGWKQEGWTKKKQPGG